MEKIPVFRPNVKSLFQKWIESRGGVAVWKSVNLSNPGESLAFTPALDQFGIENDNPRWDLRRQEIITDIKRFSFSKKNTEVKRVKVCTRVGSQGLMLKFTDGTMKRINSAFNKFPGSFYDIDKFTGEAVFYMPEFEEET